MAKITGREQQVRCLNCLERFKVRKGSVKEACPKCKMEWRISWHHDGMAKIRGPVWNKIK